MENKGGSEEVKKKIIMQGLTKDFGGSCQTNVSGLRTGFIIAILPSQNDKIALLE